MAVTPSCLKLGFLKSLMEDRTCLISFKPIPASEQPCFCSFACLFFFFLIINCWQKPRGSPFIVDGVPSTIHGEGEWGWEYLLRAPQKRLAGGWGICLQARVGLRTFTFHRCPDAAAAAPNTTVGIISSEHSEVFQVWEPHGHGSESTHINY